MLNKKINTDFLIIGGGLAGLYAAYKASEFGKVLLITKTNSEDSNSWLAQGGIAVTIDESDSAELHISDTMNAGRDLCNEEAVRVLVKEGKIRVEELIKLGMKFDKEGLNFSLGMEGGHSARRILHANGSATGQAILKFLISFIKENVNIQVLENTQCIEFAKDQNKIVGAYAYNKVIKNLYSISAKATIIASGGYSRLFERSTNSNTILGEGISLAMSAGAILKDLEFIQFHPTAFYKKNGKSFLISEAVRGEGAYLLNENLERFMVGKHELNELAPRDIISKTIFEEIQNSEIDHVYLDLRHLDSEKIKIRFSHIYRLAKSFDVDITKDLIPIAPAAHYSIGGIATDLDGRTNLAGLYSCGEASSTGVHGANRLASNSLLECLVFSYRAVIDAKNMLSEGNTSTFIENDSFEYSQATAKIYQDIREKVQNIFINNVGIIRSEKNLLYAKEQINNLKNNIEENSNYISIIKSKRLLNLSSAIIDAALARKESRGTHQRIDVPGQQKMFLGNFYVKNFQIKFKEKEWILEKTI